MAGQADLDALIADIAIKVDIPRFFEFVASNRHEREQMFGEITRQIRGEPFEREYLAILKAVHEALWFQHTRTWAAQDREIARARNVLNMIPGREPEEES